MRDELKKFNVSSGIASIYTNHSLLYSLSKRDIQAKYKGTILGFAWVVIYPLVMLAVYATVFTYVFKARWGIGESVSNFVQMLYCGLIIYGLFTDTVSRAPSAIIQNAAYVKKVIFPLELIPLSYLVSATFNAIISTILLCIFILFKQHALNITMLFFPLVLLPFLLSLLGITWFLAAIGVFFRDINQVIGVMLSLMMFLSPVFYPVTTLPAIAQKIIYLNPLTYPMEEMRNLLVTGEMPNITYWGGYCVASVLVAYMGLWVFQRSRSAFADVL